MSDRGCMERGFSMVSCFGKFPQWMTGGELRGALEDGASTCRTLEEIP